MRKRLVSILFIVALLFSLTMPAFADAEPAAETRAAAEDAPAEAAPAEAAPTETPAADPAPASEAPAADAAPANGTPAADAPAVDALAAEAPATNTPAAGTPAADAAPASEAAAAETPVAETPAADGAPASETPAADTPATDPAPANEAPAAETPAAETPVADPAPASEAPAADTPAADATPANEAPAAETPAAEETLGEGVSSEETPGEQASNVEIPAEGTPNEEAPAGEPLSEDNASDKDGDPVSGGAVSEEESGSAGTDPAEGGQIVSGDETKGAADTDAAGASGSNGSGQPAAGSGQSSELFTLIQNINAGSEMSVYIAGISEESRQSMVNILQSQLDQAIKDNKPLKITDMALPDAEKYMLSGYDELLCWAATAANMLWTSNIAQQSVNPATNANFQTVDEVFDYFRTVFTDQVGRPDGALSVFLKGTYPFQDSAGLSQLKDPASVSKRLPDEIQTPDFGLFNLQGENVKDIAAFEKLDIQSLGVLLHSYDNVDKKMGSLAHWVTSPGIIIDNTKTGLDRFKAIMIADSDNDPINGDDSIPNAEKAAKAAKAPNSYTVYPLTLKTFSTIGQRWTIPFYTRPDQSDFDVLIDWVAYVASIKPATKASEDILPGDEDGWDDDGWDEDDWDYEWDYDENDEDEPDQPADDYVIVPQPIQNDPDEFDWDDFDWDEFDWDDFDWDDMDMNDLDDFLDHVPAEQLPLLLELAKEQDGGSGFLEAIKNRMAEMNLEIFSPADWKYSLSQGGTFLVVVRTDPTQLLNVLLDGKLLTEYHKDFEVIDENTGTFLLVFSEAVMQSLEAGEHTLTLDINGIGELVRTITVVK